MSTLTLMILLFFVSLTYSCNKKSVEDLGGNIVVDLGGKTFGELGGKTFTCPDSGSSSSCDSHKCSITCSDQKRHVADCGSERYASVSSTTLPDGRTSMKVLCTDEEPKVEFEECFPFCYGPPEIKVKINQ